MTEMEIYSAIHDEVTPENKNEKFVIVMRGCRDYIFAEIAKRSQISVKYNCLLINGKTKSSSKPIEKVLNILKVKNVTY